MLKILGALIIHIIGGAVGFLVIASFAVGLNVGVHFLKEKFPEVDPEVFLAVIGLEWLILIGDTVLFIIFMVQASLKFNDELKEWRASSDS